MMAESECGISAFIRCSRERLTGKIKKYFEDFHVYEIQNNGEVCRLKEIRNKSDILTEFELKRKISSGENLFDYSRFVIDKGFVEKLSFLEVPTEYIDNILLYIQFLGEIRKQTINGNVNSKLFKFDSKGRLTTTFELKIKIPNKEFNHLSFNEAINDSEKKFDVDLTRKRRKLFHEAIRQYVPFINSQTISSISGKKTVENNAKYFESIGLYISNEILSELSKYINFEEFTTKETDKTFNKSQSSENFDSIILRPSRNFIYSLRDLGNTLRKTEEDIRAGNCDNELSKSKKAKYDDFISDTNTGLCRNYRSEDEERWDPNIPSYIHFTIYKENRDTIDAINMISKCLKRNHKSFSIAGLKDRRGITLQRASAYKVSEEQLVYATTSRNWDRNVRICDFKYTNKQINIGDLSGNLFHVVIRDLKKITENETEIGNIKLQTVKNLIDDIKTFGFINYFGLQRFGTSCIPTYKIGVSILKKNWKKAFFLILGFDEDRLEEYSSLQKEMFHEILNGEFANYIKKLSAHSYIERLVVNGLIKGIKNEKIEPKSLLGHKREQEIYKYGLNHLPKNSYSLYLHSVQSLIFNLVASERIKKFGNMPTLGDLILVKRKNPESQSTENLETLDEYVIVIENESEIGDFNIQDVVLTLPGDNVSYPPNMSMLYKKLVNELLGFDLNSSILGMKGSYRNLVVVPKDVSYTAFNLPIEERISEPEGRFPDSKLILSDLDSLLNPENNVYDEIRDNEVNINKKLLMFKNNDGEFNEVVNTIIFSCKLPKSSYVTIALRELLGSFPIE